MNLYFKKIMEKALFVVWRSIRRKPGTGNETEKKKWKIKSLVK